MSSQENILVVGGGISGITAAIEAAEVGFEVFLIDKNSYLGGRVAQMYKYFPKMCSPYCGLEINFRRIKFNPRVRIYTSAEIEDVSGQEGDFEVTLKLSPSFVNENCTACGQCSSVCPVNRSDDFNYGLSSTKAIFFPHPMSFPPKYTIDENICLGRGCAKCISICPYKAIDLTATRTRLKVKVGAIVLATGWQPFSAAKLTNLGFNKFANVITNVMMERLAAPDGPTEGKIFRPSDGKIIKRIAFVQCAGSRDLNHLAYCSGVCCSASLKQVAYLQEKIPDAQVLLFYIDIRVPGIMEDFYSSIKSNKNLCLIRGKVAKIEEDLITQDLVVVAEDTSTSNVIRKDVDMVVLATGLIPSQVEQMTSEISIDSAGFLFSNIPGIYVAGCAGKPLDVSNSVRNATGVALKAIQSIVRSRNHG